MSEWIEYLSALKTTLDIFKGIRSEIPSGPKADEAQRQIDKAEDALQKAEAELAKGLGYKLCRCTFPPQIMLWNKEEQTNICPKCGDRNPRPIEVHRVPDHEPSWIAARRGR
jgi:hypothetical protein